MSLEKKAIDAINKNHILLVFPINNKKEPFSLWNQLYLRSEMRWEWDENGDNRVAKLWHLRAELSTSRQVIYSKWYQSRATFFSLVSFRHLLAAMRAHEERDRLTISEAKNIMEALEMDSPLSTKQLKEVAELQGKKFEAYYNRVMKLLWLRGLIVAFGEIEDSSFPSLAVGATSTLFEDLWQESAELDENESRDWLIRNWGEDNLFTRHLVKNLKPI